MNDTLTTAQALAALPNMLGVDWPLVYVGMGATLAKGGVWAFPDGSAVVTVAAGPVEYLGAVEPLA